jgi:hypothetical protein
MDFSTTSNVIRTFGKQEQFCKHLGKIDYSTLFSAEIFNFFGPSTGFLRLRSAYCERQWRYKLGDTSSQRPSRKAFFDAHTASLDYRGGRYPRKCAVRARPLWASVQVRDKSGKNVL